jgi:hypothetical protein
MCTRGRRTGNGSIGLRVPLTVIKAKCAPYLMHGQPERRKELLSYDDYTIVNSYGSQYRGVVQYYLLAGDVWRFDRLRWVMETSMLKTLASKHRSTVTTMARTFKSILDTPHGPHMCFEANAERNSRQPLVARFGGIPLRRQKRAVLHDRLPIPVTVRRKELISRLLTGRCEWCAQRTTMAEVHHVRRLADLARPGRPQPAWAQLMAKRRRKTLVVCRACHDTIHARQPTATPTE